MDKPREIKKQNMELTKEHMGEGRKKYFIHENKLMKEIEIDSEWAKKICKARGKKWEKLMPNIPTKLRGVFKHVRPPKNMKKDAYGDIFTSPTDT